MIYSCQHSTIACGVVFRTHAQANDDNLLVIQPLVEVLTCTLDGIVNQLLTRYPSDPRFLKITAGSLTPDVVLQVQQ